MANQQTTMSQCSKRTHHICGHYPNNTRRRQPWPHRTYCWTSEIPHHDWRNSIYNPSKPRNLPSRTSTQCSSGNTGQRGGIAQRTHCPIENPKRSQTGIERHHYWSSGRRFYTQNQRWNPQVFKLNTTKHNHPFAKLWRGTWFCKHQNPTGWKRSGEVPTVYFNRVEKVMKQLTCTGITLDLK